MGDGALARRALGYLAVDYTKIGFWSYEWLWEQIEVERDEMARIAAGRALPRSEELARRPFGAMRSIVGSPNPTVGCTIGLFSHIDGMKFVKYIHPERPPICMLFRSRDGLREMVAVVSTLAGTRINQIPGTLWSQFALDNGMSLDVPDPSGRIVLRDLLGNVVARGRSGGSLAVPVSPDPMFLHAPAGVLEEAVLASSSRNFRPVEIEIRDFVQPMETGPEVNISVRNALSVPLDGTVTAKVGGAVLESNSIEFAGLQPGEVRRLPFRVVAQPQGIKNLYPVEVSVATPFGRADLAETVQVATIVRGSITVDGQDEDWKAIGSVPVLLAGKASEKDLTTEAWFGKDASDKAANLTTRAAFAWDDANLYVWATVKDDKAELYPPYLSGRNQHDLQPAPYDFIYVHKGPHPAEEGDCLIVSADKVGRSKPMPKFEYYPPTDPAYRYAVFMPCRYSYQLNATTENDGEMLRLHTPDFFWMNCFPIDYARLAERCRVQGGKVVARRTAGGYVYEAAIPWTELGEITPATGGRLRLSFRVKSNRFWVEKVWGEFRQNALRTSHISGFHNSWAEESEWGFCGERQ